MVIVAVPAATASRVTSLPDTFAVTVSSSELSAENVSSSPSGSVKWEEALTFLASPSCRSWAGIRPSSFGGRFSSSSSTTVTSKAEATDSPSGSVAVTVTVAVPSASAENVTSLPDTFAVTTSSSELPAENVSSSPSGSVK